MKYFLYQTILFSCADSPFYEVAAADLPKQKFELVAVMEGTNETSNAKFQARTSYLPQGEGLLDVLISKLITSHSIALHYRDPLGPQI